jgi:hypothetical protein
VIYLGAGLAFFAANALYHQRRDVLEFLFAAAIFVLVIAAWPLFLAYEISDAVRRHWRRPRDPQSPASDG